MDSSCESYYFLNGTAPFTTVPPGFQPKGGKLFENSYPMNGYQIISITYFQRAFMPSQKEIDAKQRYQHFRRCGKLPIMFNMLRRARFESILDRKYNIPFIIPSLCLLTKGLFCLAVGVSCRPLCEDMKNRINSFEYTDEACMNEQTSDSRHFNLTHVTAAVAAAKGIRWALKVN